MRRTGLILLVLLAACSDDAPVKQLPDPPAPLYLPDEYAFGTKMQIEDSAVIRAAEDFIEAQLARGDLKPRVRHWVAPRGTDLAALAKRYDAAAATAGWQPIGRLKDNLWSGGSGVAYRRGDQAFAVVWVNGASPSGSRPVAVIRYEDES